MPKANRRLAESLARLDLSDCGPRRRGPLAARLSRPRPAIVAAPAPRRPEPPPVAPRPAAVANRPRPAAVAIPPCDPIEVRQRMYADLAREDRERVRLERAPR